MHYKVVLGYLLSTVGVQALVTRDQPCYYTSSKKNTCGVSGTIESTTYEGAKYKNIPGLSYCAVVSQSPAVDLRHPYGHHYVKSFRYNNQTSECDVFYKKIKVLEVQPGPSNETFFDVACFNCLPTSCPQPPGHNVVVNSGFEQLPNSPEPWYALNAYEPLNISYPGYKSAHALGAFYNQGQTILQFQAFQDFRWCPNSYYLTKFVYKFAYTGNNNDTLLEPRISLSIGTGATAFDPPISQNNTWVAFYGLWTSSGPGSKPRVVPIGGGIELTTSIGSAGSTLIFDNFQIISVAPQEQPRENLVTDSGFESGFNPWQFQASNVQASFNCTVGPSGSGFNSSYAAVCSNAMLFQEIPTVPGQAYSLDFDWKAIQESPDDNCNIIPTFASTGLYGTVVGSFINDTWTHTQTFVAAYMNSTLIGLTGPCITYIDNVVVKEATIQGA